MPHYISILVDKSALQSLTRRETEWLGHHFRVLITPVFFAELIGDLKKESRRTSTGEPAGDVSMLSHKLDGANIDLAMPVAKVVEMELRGRSFPLDGRPLIANAERVAMPDGTFGMFVDQSPFQRTLDRWIAGDFDGMEQAFAEVWRAHLGNIDLEQLLKMSKSLRRDGRRHTSADVAQYVLRFLGEGFWEDQLRRWMHLAGMERVFMEMVIRHWRTLGAPPPRQYAPYTQFVAFVRAYFHVAVATRVITTKSSNKIDMEYFEFLPFVRAFTSNDKIHAENFEQLGWSFNSVLCLIPAGYYVSISHILTPATPIAG